RRFGMGGGRTQPDGSRVAGTIGISPHPDRTEQPEPDTVSAGARQRPSRAAPPLQWNAANATEHLPFADRRATFSPGGRGSVRASSRCRLGRSLAPLLFTPSKKRHNPFSLLVLCNLQTISNLNFKNWIEFSCFLTLHSVVKMVDLRKDQSS